MNAQTESKPDLDRLSLQEIKELKERLNSALAEVARLKLKLSSIRDLTS
jgi:uncharacterized small protein (DUF1192 family)